MRDSLDYLCCPRCHGDLTLNAERIMDEQIICGFLQCQACYSKYKVEDGIPDFLLTESLNERDKKWMSQYDATARSYDLIMCYLIPLFSVGLEPFERGRWVKQLQINEGAHVLDVSTGTGKNLSFILKKIGPNGRLAAMDLSKGMLAYAKMKIKNKKWKNVELQKANASYLPYKSGMFDAVMHVGGINTFGEKRRALLEMVRVAKSNAKIIIVDEGLASKKQKTFFGKFLIKQNALYACKPPTKLLPRDAKNLKVTWKIVLSLPFINMSWPFYKMEFQKA